MGYQESFITIKETEKFDLFLDQLSVAYEEGYFEDAYASPVAVVILKKEVNMHEPGTKFLYVIGERYGQRSMKDFMGEYYTSLKNKDGFEIIFIEELPTDRLFTNLEGDKEQAIGENMYVWGQGVKFYLETHKKRHNKKI